MFAWNDNENAYVYVPKYSNWINSLPNRKEQRGCFELCIMTYTAKFVGKLGKYNKLKQIAKAKGKPHDWAPRIVFGCLDNKCSCCDPRGRKRHNKGKNKTARAIRYSIWGQDDI